MNAILVAEPTVCTDKLSNGVNITNEPRVFSLNS